MDVHPRAGELVRVELLDLLDKETLASVKPMRDEMVRLSELRAGVRNDTP
jgi:hypothetical protein